MTGPENGATSSTSSTERERRGHRPGRRTQAGLLAAALMVAGGASVVGESGSSSSSSGGTGTGKPSGVDVGLTFKGSGTPVSIHVPAAPPQAVLDQQPNSARLVAPFGPAGGNGDTFSSAVAMGSDTYITAGHAFDLNDSGAKCSAYSLHAAGGQSAKLSRAAGGHTRGDLYKQDLAAIKLKAGVPTGSTASFGTAVQQEVVWNVGWGPVNGKQIDPTKGDKPVIFPGIVLESNVGDGQMVVVTNVESYNNGGDSAKEVQAGQSGGGVYDGAGSLIGLDVAVLNVPLSYYGAKGPGNAQLELVQLVDSQKVNALTSALGHAAAAC